MFMAALFTIAKTWKQPKCALTDEWIKKRWYMYTMEYYSAIKKNKIIPLAATWMDLEIIILSKSDRERQVSYDITYMWNLKKKIQMNLFTKQKQTHRHRKQTYGDFPGGPGVGIHLPMQGTRVRSLVGELRSHMPQGN